MTSACSECSALRIAQEELNLVIPVTTSWTLARCQELAKSNEPPNDAESVFLRAVVSNTASRLTCLEEEISRLKERLALLETERRQLSNYHSQDLAILSPLRRMPSELITEILSWSLPRAYELGANASDVEKKAPFVLSQVSGRWRNIALSTPSLWSLVQVWAKNIDTSVIKLVRVQVERARKLKIHFYASEDADSAMQVTLFDFLSEHAPRWEELSVQLTPTLVPRLGVLRGRLPSLQRLWIQWENTDSHVGANPIKCFETASSLLDVGIQRESGTFIPVPFPSHQLTSYRLQGPWEMHQQMLTLAPNVVEASIQIVTSDAEESWPPNTSGTALELSHLRRLYVSHAEILDYIRTPALDELAIWIDQPEGMVDRIDSFLLRSLCITLRRLYFNGIPHAATTGEILKKYPSITGLMLSFGEGTEEESTAALHDHLTMLSVRDDSASIISPHLSEISLAFPLSTPIDYPLSLRMLQSRHKNPSCALVAATFAAVGVPGLDPVTLAGFRGLGEGGLSVLVRLGSKAQKYYLDRVMYACPWI